MRRRRYSAVRAAVAARALVAKPAFQGALLGVGAAAAQLGRVRLAALPAAGRLYELDEWGDLQASTTRACHVLLQVVKPDAERACTAM